MWDRLGGIVGLLIGTCCILFRKSISRLFIRKQIEEGASQRAKKTKESFQKLKEMKLEGILRKGLEIISIAFGVLLVLMSISEFFPQTGNYIGYFIAYFLLAFFAACVAGLIELKFIAPFLMRDIRKYTQERDNWPWIVKHSSGSDSPHAMNTGPTDDSMFRSLQRKFLIYLVVSFVVLFVIFLSAFCTIFRLTS